MATFSTATGTQAKYDALPNRNATTLYFITDTRRIYFGDNRYEEKLIVADGQENIIELVTMPDGDKAISVSAEAVVHHLFQNSEDFFQLIVQLAQEYGVEGPAGTSPHIGSNGNWWVGTTDTGVNAKGDHGDSITITGSSFDSEGNTLVTFSDGTTITVNRGLPGESGGFKPPPFDENVGQILVWEKENDEFANIAEVILYKHIGGAGGGNDYEKIYLFGKERE